MFDPAHIKASLAHDWLTGMRGGERVLEEFCAVLPQADLYTLVHRAGSVSELIENRPIHTSFLQRLPGGIRHYRYFLPLYPWAVSRLRPRGIDLLLSSSHAAAKGIRPPAGALHVSYVHAPMRYMWDGFDEYFGVGRARWPVRMAARLLRPVLQKWDRQSAAMVDHFIVNSRFIQEQVRRFYGRDSTVIHPPVSLERFSPGGAKADFFLMVGAFAPNKRVHHAIETFNRLQLPLCIVGGGQEEARCRALAGDTIQFLGELGDEETALLYRQARAFIFPGRDDFGITPLEAQASGTPVIAWAAGGALETVSPQTGILYEREGPEALEEAMNSFLAGPERFHPAACIANARRFGRERFRREILEFLEEVWTTHVQNQRTGS